MRTTNEIGLKLENQEILLKLLAHLIMPSPSEIVPRGHRHNDNVHPVHKSKGLVKLGLISS